VENRSSPFAGITQIKFYVWMKQPLFCSWLLPPKHYGISQINHEGMAMHESDAKPLRSNTRLQYTCFV
jgi:hypothetical protein